MAQRRHHYEHAFERYLRDHRVPYISVDEAKKSLMPTGVSMSVRRGERSAPKLKNFDFVIYGEGGNLLVEVKGRRLPRIRLKDGSPAKPRMESWVTRDDVEAMRRWGALFGPEFEASFIFMYWCEDVPPDGLFVETLAHRGRWYTMRSIDVESYAGVMRDRSRRWGTVSVPTEEFERLSRPFSVPGWVESSGGGVGYVREPMFERLGV